MRSSALLVATALATLLPAQAPRHVPLIFDTDIGNDIDDVLALALIHALEARGECRLLAVTITKDHALAAPFVDAIDTFYGRGDVPIGVCRSGVTPGAGPYLGLANAVDDGTTRYPHDLASGTDAPDAVAVLRRVLADAADGSVAIAQVGFSTNLADLLASPADDISPLTGTELAHQKVRVLSLMAGAFTPIADQHGEPREYREYNVINDIPAARTVAASWPTPMIWSGFEVGLALRYPNASIARDFGWAPHHPVAAAYRLYAPQGEDRPCWDLTSVLAAVRPEHGYFELSEPGVVSVADNGVTTFAPGAAGQQRYLRLQDAARARIVEAFVLLASQPTR